jgi:hypothetical protein
MEREKAEHGIVAGFSRHEETAETGAGQRA